MDAIGPILEKIQSLPTQKLLSLINKSLFKGLMATITTDGEKEAHKRAKQYNQKVQYEELAKKFMAIMMKNTGELSYSDSIATLRLIKTLQLENGQKRLIGKLQKNIITQFSKELADVIKSIDRARDIFKVPSFELHKELITKVCEKDDLDPLFHLQFIIQLIKETKMVESPKLNKEEKQLEQEILDYMEKFTNNQSCLELFFKAASKNHKIKVLMMLTKHIRQDYVSGIVSPEMEISHTKQREIVNQLQQSLLEDFRYERNMPVLIMELSNLKYFIENSTLTGISLNPEFIEIFNKCASKIQFNELQQLNDMQLNRVVEAAPESCGEKHFWGIILESRASPTISHLSKLTMNIQ